MRARVNADITLPSVPDWAVPSVNAGNEWSDKAISRAIGEELRRTREARGWSRLQVAEQLPSGIGDRTLTAYEHGTRCLNAIRLIELCYVLEVDPPTLLRRALQRARINLANLNMHVNLRALVNDQNDVFRPMTQWARNSLNEYPGGVVEVEPAVVRHLALFVGCEHHKLANYLARFLPDDPGVWTSD